jgi:hypothetical protein
MMGTHYSDPLRTWFSIDSTSEKEDFSQLLLSD